MSDPEFLNKVQEMMTFPALGFFGIAVVVWRLFYCSLDEAINIQEQIYIMGLAGIARYGLISLLYGLRGTSYATMPWKSTGPFMKSVEQGGLWTLSILRSTQRQTIKNKYYHAQK
jgi:hypothetical protein